MKEDIDIYFPGDVSSDIFESACKEVRYMLHLVAYDIADPKRLSRVAKVCKDYGIRVEYSVFECDLPPYMFEEMWRELNAIIDHDNDAIIAYIICRSCVERTIVAGTAARSDKPVLVIA
jgi:CRISPR-associated protein Cas2